MSSCPCQIPSLENLFFAYTVPQIFLGILISSSVITNITCPGWIVSVRFPNDFVGEYSLEHVLYFFLFGSYYFQIKVPALRS